MFDREDIKKSVDDFKKYMGRLLPPLAIKMLDNIIITAFFAGFSEGYCYRITDEDEG